MERYLNDYIERMRPAFHDLDRELAHQISLIYLTFKMGSYEDTIHRCNAVQDLISDTHPRTGNALQKAITIVRIRATDLQEAGMIITPLPSFEGEERAFMAVDLDEKSVSDLSHLHLVNALLMLYAAGRIASSRDEQALDEHQNFAVNLINPYKEALGME
jgi:hypothetical protein